MTEPPAVNLDFVTTEELIAELVKRHTSIVIGRSPRSSELSMVRAWGDHMACRGLADALIEYVRATAKHATLPQEGA